MAQGLFLVNSGVAQGHLVFGPQKGFIGWMGWVLVAYASVGYPLLGQLLGDGYPEMPIFGITPCTVTLFTFGLFLLTTKPVPRHLLVIPVVWSLIGGQAAFRLGITQDWLLFFSGLTVIALLSRDHKRQQPISNS